MQWIPLNDLSRSIHDQRELLTGAFARVVESSWVVMGPEHTAFEQELAEYLGAAHALGVASGTDALEIALRAVVDPARPVVVTAANAGGYTTTAARRGGFRLRYADVDEATMCLTPATVAPVLDGTVGAVVVTHLYGRAADVAGIRALCEPLGVPVVEDCAQAIGARTADGRVGSLSDVAAFSFYPTKNLGALGDGGAVVTSSAQIADRVRVLRQYGWTSKYRITQDGGRNSRLDEVQAAVLRARMPLLDEANATRRALVERYRASASERVRVLDAQGEGHVGHLAVVVVDDRDAFVAHLAERGIRSDVHYPVPDHRQPAFAAEHADVSLPVTEHLADRIVSLPCFPELAAEEIERVCDALAAF